MYLVSLQDSRKEVQIMSEMGRSEISDVLNNPYVGWAPLGRRRALPTASQPCVCTDSMEYARTG